MSSDVPGSVGCSYRHAVSSYVPSINNFDTEEVSHHLLKVLSDAAIALSCRDMFEKYNQALLEMRQLIVKYTFTGRNVMVLPPHYLLVLLSPIFFTQPLYIYF